MLMAFLLSAAVVSLILVCVAMISIYLSDFIDDFGEDKKKDD